MFPQKYKQKKGAMNKTEYEVSSVTYEVTFYFNVLNCGANILNRLEVTYERACMATIKEKYYTKILETIVDYNDRNNAPLSNEKLRHTVSKVMV